MEKKTTHKAKATNKNMFIALGVAIALLVVVIVCGFMFFQSPERRLASGFANFVKAGSISINGTVSATNSNGAYETKIQAKTDKKVVDADVDFKYTGIQAASLRGKAQVMVAEDGVLYAKLDQPQQFMSAFADSFIKPSLTNLGLGSFTPEQQAAAFAPVRSSLVDAGKKMDNKWLKINQAELRVLTGGGSNTSSDCYVQFSRELDSNTSARNQLASAYMKHQFIDIDDSLPADGSSKGYRVSIDQAKLKEFNDSVASNAAVKKLGTCGQDILTLGAADNLSDQSVDIWVDQFSNNITRVKYDKETADGTSKVDLSFVYGANVSVQTPTNTAKLDDILPAFTQ